MFSGEYLISNAQEKRNRMATQKEKCNEEGASQPISTTIEVPDHLSTQQSITRDANTEDPHI